MDINGQEIKSRMSIKDVKSVIKMLHEVYQQDDVPANIKDKIAYGLVTTTSYGHALVIGVDSRNTIDDISIVAAESVMELAVNVHGSNDVPQAVKDKIAAELNKTDAGKEALEVPARNSPSPSVAGSTAPECETKFSSTNR